MKQQEWCNKKYAMYLNKIWKPGKKQILRGIYKMNCIHLKK